MTGSYSTLVADVYRLRRELHDVEDLARTAARSDARADGYAVGYEEGYSEGYEAGFKWAGKPS